MKSHDECLNLTLAFFDRKRTFVEKAEAIYITEGMGISLVKKLARISRGLFNPTDIRDEISTWEGRPRQPTREYLRNLFGEGFIIRAFFKGRSIW